MAPTRVGAVSPHQGRGFNLHRRENAFKSDTPLVMTPTLIRREPGGGHQPFENRFEAQPVRPKRLASTSARKSTASRHPTEPAPSK